MYWFELFAPAHWCYPGQEQPLVSSNRFAHAPEEWQRPLRHACDVLAPSLMLQIYPEGRVDRVVEGGLVQPPRDGFFLVESPGLVPCRNLGLDRREIGPSEKCLVA